VFENLWRWRFFVVNCLDLIGGKVSVEDGLQAERSCRRVAGHQSQLLATPPPRQLLVRNSIVTSMSHDVLEEFQEVHLTST
jgi:hypothetical protein